MKLIDKYKLKKEIKKFNYMVYKEDNDFLNSLNKLELGCLLEYIKDIRKILDKFYKDSRNRYHIHFESYNSIYKNFNPDTFLDEIKKSIREENLSRRSLFYSFIDGNTSINEEVYKNLCNVSSDFSRSYLKLVNKRNLSLNLKISSWFYISQNKYILEIIHYCEGNCFKDDRTEEIRLLENKVFGIKDSKYKITSWKSSIAYLYRLEDIEEAILFGDDPNIRRDITKEIIQLLTYEGEEDDVWADDKFWESLGIFSRL